MIIAMAQLNPTIGDLAGNTGKIVKAAEQARRAGAALAVFPELAVTGYPPRDLLCRPDFLRRVARVLEETIAPASREIPLLLGAPVAGAPVGAGLSGPNAGAAPPCIQKAGEAPHGFSATNPGADAGNADADHACPETRDRAGRGVIPAGPAGFLYNAALLYAGGRLVGRQDKSLLPDYDVFDESRYFKPAAVREPVWFAGRRLGVTICEDIWNDKDYWNRQLYEIDPVEELAARGAELIINISASPYHYGKIGQRVDMLCRVAAKHRVGIIYVNQAGGNDELIFDGTSLAVDARGGLAALAGSFVEDLVLVDTDSLLAGKSPSASVPELKSVETKPEEAARALASLPGAAAAAGAETGPARVFPAREPVPAAEGPVTKRRTDDVRGGTRGAGDWPAVCEEEYDSGKTSGGESRAAGADAGGCGVHKAGRAHLSGEDISYVHRALVLGIRDYLHKTGFQKALVGLSGGIDSSVTAALAAEALGTENVLGVSMPSRYSSPGSRNDARELAANLGIAYRELPIEGMFAAYLSALNPADQPVGDLAEENVQARIRGNILMFISNREGYLTLTTGNKSEMAVGYCTLYGDMSGGLAVLADVPKVMVYELARYINRERPVIPPDVLSKPPSAELRPDQKDQDSLPPYEVLDAILHDYIEENKPVEEIAARGIDPGLVTKITGWIDRAEYKRRQAAPGLRVTSKAFGTGRRMPIAWRRG
ncbi:NAD(+) synthase [Desulfotomaculum copahuensis]|uniref:NAD(+) synthase n=1 Tax=Desulfotomaculum copahuensis TaxID=1838280 RepID=UPI000B173AAA|nr:NAD(+) synthase [Desulfotomaculum copahuensis]